MDSLNQQENYWNQVSRKKVFTHPIPLDKIKKEVPSHGKILDFGCGYGRTCHELTQARFSHVIGIDISSNMINLGLEKYPSLTLKQFDGMTIPYPDQSFDACTLMAVLTCIPTDEGQKNVIEEISRVLIPGGILFVSDYPLQDDERNVARYREFSKEFENYGTFRLPDHGIVRHHDEEWIYSLLSPFELFHQYQIMGKTMNGNHAKIFQNLGKKK